MSINLIKGQKIDLKKKDGSSLSKVFMGLGWDEANSSKPVGFLKGIFGGPSQSSGGAIDLDASCVLLDDKKNVLDIVYFGNKKSSNGAVKHSGDNLTGAGEGDDEVIKVDLSQIPANVQHVVFTINSYSGQKFSQIENCFARLVVDNGSGEEICIYKLQEYTNNTAMVMAKMYRNNGDWKMAAIGVPCNGSTVQSIISTIQNNI